MDQVIITLTNDTTDYQLIFTVLPTPLGSKWLDQVALFNKAGQPWDDARRFYNFVGSEYTEAKVILRLQELVDVIKNYAPGLIDRHIIGPLTQDDLNYLHHIFELYHGLYDRQKENEFFMNAPTQVQDALGDLNIWIHRYESLGGIPRFVATWKFKPYRHQFTDDELELFDLAEEWGDLRLNYCEIGKSLYDMWRDDDQYILPEAFRPHHHYCFDFTVRFTPYDKHYYDDIRKKVWDYFDRHEEFFLGLGYKKYDPKLCLGGVTVAKLINDGSKSNVLQQIARHQKFKSIRIC